MCACFSLFSFGNLLILSLVCDLDQEKKEDRGGRGVVREKPVLLEQEVKLRRGIPSLIFLPQLVLTFFFLVLKKERA